MTLDEKTCWNTTFIIVDNIASTFGIFQAYFKEVGLIAKSIGSKIILVVNL
jgi:hypothetical protein